MTAPELGPTFAYAASVQVAVAEPIELGTDALGHRRVIPIVGGEVSGGWTGAVLHGGADWQTVLRDGTVLITAHYPVRLDGVGTACFEVRGVRRPYEPEFCTTLRLTGLPDTELGATTYVTVGAKDGGVVAYDAYVADSRPFPAGVDSAVPLRMEHRFTIEVDLLPPIDGPATEFGVEQIIAIVGGRVEGPALHADVLPIGADWAVERGSGALDVHARYAIRADDGAVIGVDNVGHWRERGRGAAPYFMTAPVFVAEQEPHQWLTRGVFLAPAIERSLTRVGLFVHEVTPASTAPALGPSGSVAATGPEPHE
jgi:hypothetical protein